MLPNVVITTNIVPSNYVQFQNFKMALEILNWLSRLKARSSSRLCVWICLYFPTVALIACVSQLASTGKRSFSCKGDSYGPQESLDYKSGICARSPYWKGAEITDVSKYHVKPYKISDLESINYTFLRYLKSLALNDLKNATVVIPWCFALEFYFCFIRLNLNMSCYR